MTSKNTRSSAHVLFLAFDRLVENCHDHDNEDKDLDQMVMSKISSVAMKVVRQDRVFVIFGSGKIEAGNIITGQDFTEEIKNLISEVVINNL
jgi:hypothetical protein